MITLFFMSIPIPNNPEKLLGESASHNQSKDNELLDILQENINCTEIKLQLEDNCVNRILAKEIIVSDVYINIEKICRQYSNQDVLVKIRNGKKTVIERTRIIQP